MDKFCLRVAYNGKWTMDNKYLDHETKLILVNDEITFEGLVEKIFQVLKLKRGEIQADIRFDAKLDTSKGMLVTNDEEVTTCIYLLRHDSSFKNSRFIVDISERNSLPEKSSETKLCDSSVCDVNVEPQEEEKELQKIQIEKCETLVDDEAFIMVEPIMALEYSTDEKSEETGQTSNDTIVKSSVRLSKKRERSTSSRHDLPPVVLREDASFDEIVVGSIFEDKESLKKCVSNNAIKCHFKFKVDRSNQRRYNLKCYDDECSWYLHSSQVQDSSLFRITKFFQTHSCSVDMLSDQRHMTSRLLSNYIIELLRDSKAKLKPDFVVEEVKKRYGLTISYNKAWRAIQLALGVIGTPEKNHEESNNKSCRDTESYDLPTVVSVVLREDASLDEVVVGSIFEDKERLKKCVSNNAIKYNFKFKVDRSNQKRYNLKCYDDECNWCLHSSKVHDSSLFRIHKFEKRHSCSVDVLSDQRHATSKVISDYVIELLHDTKEEIKPNFVVEELRKRYGLNISYHKAWRAIQLTLGVTRESPDQSPEFCPPSLKATEESKCKTSLDIVCYDQTQTQ